MKIVSFSEKSSSFSTLEKLRPKIKIKKMTWEFHKGDSDLNPSVPHGHSLDGKFKLQLWSGNIFDVRTNVIIMRAKRRDMQALYNLEGFREFVDEFREVYKEKYGTICLPKLSKRIFDNNILRNKLRLNKTKSRDTFTVDLRLESNWGINILDNLITQKL